MSKRKIRRKKNIDIKFNFKRPIFNKWLEENIHKFNIKPIYIGDDTYTFDNFTNNIKLQMNFNQLEASLIFFDDNDDCIGIHDIEYIGDEQYDVKNGGYYDADRIEGCPFRYFATQKELYTVEVFESLLRYVNEMLISTNYLFTSGEDDCSTNSTICSMEEYISKKYDRSIRIRCTNFDEKRDDSNDDEIIFSKEFIESTTKITQVINKKIYTKYPLFSYNNFIKKGKENEKI